MSLLRQGGKVRQNKQMKTKNPFQTKCNRPSPKYGCGCQNSFSPILTRIRNVIKGISMPISRQKDAGSMTVEAALLLPLFLFFFLNLGSAIELIRLHGNLELALCDVGNSMTIYGYALWERSEGRNAAEEGVSSEWLAELEDFTLSYTYVKRELTDYLGEDYLEESPVAEGADGLQFLESEIFGTGDCVDVIVTYRVEPFAGIVGVRPFRMANRFYGHLWNGYEIPGTGAEQTEDLVYVTENGEVYHEDRNCSHLQLSIREVSYQEACGSRNASGARYIPCEVCGGDQMADRVYIAEDGTAIHNNRNCSGLKRTVSAIPREKAGKYRPCRDCAGG